MIEIDVAADALGAERRGGEARAHGEVVDLAPIARRHDRRRSRRPATLTQDSVRSAPRPPVVRQHGVAHGDGIARVDDDDLVADAERASSSANGASVSRPMTRPRGADAPPRLGGAEQARFAARAEHDHRLARVPQSRATCGAAPATSSTASARRSGMSAGILRERRRGEDDRRCPRRRPAPTPAARRGRASARAA